MRTHWEHKKGEKSNTSEVLLGTSWATTWELE